MKQYFLKTRPLPENYVVIILSSVFAHLNKMPTTALWTVNDVPEGLQGSFPRHVSPGKTPQSPVNPPRGSFQGFFL